MPLHAELFWSFRSPYSYLATRRYVALSQDYDLTLNLRPVYPLAIRDPDFFERNHPNWLSYTFSDCYRVAQHLQIPMEPPKPDPVVQDLASRKISDDQPYIFRLARLGQAAARRGKSLAFCDEVSRLIWPCPMPTCSIARLQLAKPHLRLMAIGGCQRLYLKVSHFLARIVSRSLCGECAKKDSRSAGDGASRIRRRDTDCRYQ